MNRRIFLQLPAAAAAQVPAPAQQRIDLTLERLQQDSGWVRLDPQTVLASGDRIRFQFTSNAPGWLCVYYTGSGGQSEWLWPPGAGSRLITKDTAQLIPAEPAAYSVAGPPGLDVLYWILSPQQVPLESLVPPRAPRSVPSTLIPRCRGGAAGGQEQASCLDDRAGPAPLDTASSPFRQTRRLRARELKIDSGSTGASIQTAERNIGVIVYEFRIAHR